MRFELALLEQWVFTTTNPAVHPQEVICRLRKTERTTFLTIRTLSHNLACQQQARIRVSGNVGVIMVPQEKCEGVYEVVPYQNLELGLCVVAENEKTPRAADRSRGTPIWQFLRARAAATPVV